MTTPTTPPNPSDSSSPPLEVGTSSGAAPASATNLVGPESTMVTKPARTKASKGAMTPGKALRLVVVVSVVVLAIVIWSATRTEDKATPIAQPKTGHDFGDDELTKNKNFRETTGVRLTDLEAKNARLIETNAKLQEVIDLQRAALGDKGASTTTISPLATTMLARIGDDDLALLPTYLRSRLAEVVSFVETLALNEGKILPDQTAGPLKLHVQSLLHGSRIPDTFDGDIKTLAQVARVRPDPLNDRLINEVPGLCARRDLAAIPRADVAGIARMAAGIKDLLPPYTAGQLLSLSNQVATVPTGKYARLVQEILDADRDQGTTQVERTGVVVVGGMTIKRQALPQVVMLLAPRLLENTAASPSTPEGATLGALLLAQRNRLADRAFPPQDAATPPLVALTVLEQDLPVLVDQAKRFAGLSVLIRAESSRTPPEMARLLNGVAAAAVLGDLAHQTAAITQQGSDRLKHVQVQEGGVANLWRQTAPWTSIRDLYQATLEPPRGEGAKPIRTDAVTGSVAADWDRSLLFAARILETTRSVAQPLFATQPQAKDRFDRAAPVLVAAVIASSLAGERDALQGRDTGDKEGRMVAQVVACGLASALAQQEARATLVPGYHSYESDDRIWSPLLAALPTAADLAVAGVVERSKPTWHPDRIAETAAALSREALQDIEQRMVRTILQGRVHRRMLESGIIASDELIKEADDHAAIRVGILVRPPFSLDRMQRAEDQVLRECQDILGGRRKKAATGTANLEAKAQVTVGNLSEPTRIIPVINNTTGSDRMPLIGTSRHQSTTRVVTIPAHSFGNAHLLHGVTVQLGGSAKIKARLDRTWHSSNGQALMMPALLMEGTATVVPPGGCAITVDSLSYTFANGHDWYAKVDGYIVDNGEDSTNVIPGTIRYPWEMLPPMMLAAGGQAFAQSLIGSTAPNVTIVNSAGGQTIETPENPVRNAALAGVGGAVGSTANWMNEQAAYFKVTLTIAAGRQVTATLSQPVVINVPESDWAAQDQALETPGF